MSTSFRQVAKIQQYKYRMEYFKLINWEPSTSQLLSTMPIFESDKAYVRPLPIDVQHKIFNLLNIDISDCNTYNVMLVRFPPNTHIGIHSDKPVDIPEDRRISQAIILPLENCSNLVWNWYEAVDSNAVYYYGEAGSWKRVSFLHKWGSKLVESTMCDKPFISDIGTFHALRNDGDQLALAISIRLMPWSYKTVQDCEELPPIPGLTIK